MTGTKWKREERNIARILGGERSSEQGKSSPDVTTKWLKVEVKDRQGLPKWITSGLAKSRSHAAPGQLGILIMHEAGNRDRLVVLSLKDFVDWFGGGRK